MGIDLLCITIIRSLAGHWEEFGASGHLRTKVLGTPHSTSMKDMLEFEEYHGKAEPKPSVPSPGNSCDLLEQVVFYSCSGSFDDWGVEQTDALDVSTHI